MSARRLDWHVLLPGEWRSPPGRWLLPGAGLDLPRRAVELGLASSAAADDREPAEVVALLHAAAGTPEQAARSLASGGLLYWEVDRASPTRIFLTRGRAARRLRAAGLAPLATYWVGPGWGRPTRFLPLDEPGPLRWYLSTVAVSTNPVAALLQMLLRAIARRPAVVGLLVPRFAIIAAAEPLPASRRPAILADVGVPAVIRSSPVHPVVVSGGEEPWSRVTLVAFGPDGRAPSAIVKAARRPEDDKATRHEHEILVDLRESLDDALRASVPEPIALLAGPRRTAIVQGAAPGVSALARLRRWPKPTDGGAADLGLTTAWLIRFHTRTTRSRELPGTPGWRAHLDVPLERYLACIGPSEPVVRLLERTRAHAASVGSELPIVLQHRDLGPWNVLVDGSRIRVVDWEVARDGPAMIDLVYAGIHWSFVARGARTEVERRALLRRLLTEEDRPARQLRATLHRYGRALGVDPRLVPALVVLALAGQALDRHDRLALDAASVEPQANRYVGYVEELAGLEDAWLTQGPLTRPIREASR